MKEFILGILATLIIGGLVFGAYQYGKKTLMLDNQQPIISSQPSVSSIQASPVSQQSGSSSSQLVGGDEDEHGCKGSAGYSWCEAKKKCLRVFEEGCPQANDSELIKQALFKKNNWTDDGSMTLTVSTNDGKYASGGVTAEGGGGYFYAAKVNDAWKIVADGNGVILCTNLTAYPDYPKTLISECFDEASNKSIKR